MTDPTTTPPDRKELLEALADRTCRDARQKRYQEEGRYKR